MKYLNFSFVQHSTCNLRPRMFIVFPGLLGLGPPHSTSCVHPRMEQMHVRTPGGQRCKNGEWWKAYDFSGWNDVRRSMSLEPLLCQNILWMLNRILSFWYFLISFDALIFSKCPPHHEIYNIYIYITYIYNMIHIYIYHIYYIRYSSIFNLVKFSKKKSWDALGPASSS